VRRSKVDCLDRLTGHLSKVGETGVVEDEGGNFHVKKVLINTEVVRYVKS
jgi:hypothetical protein